MLPNFPFCSCSLQSAQDMISQEKSFVKWQIYNYYPWMDSFLITVSMSLNNKEEKRNNCQAKFTPNFPKQKVTPCSFFSNRKENLINKSRNTIWTTNHETQFEIMQKSLKFWRKKIFLQFLRSTCSTLIAEGRKADTNIVQKDMVPSSKE